MRRERTYLLRDLQVPLPTLAAPSFPAGHLDAGPEYLSQAPEARVSARSPACVVLSWGTRAAPVGAAGGEAVSARDQD